LPPVQRIGRSFWLPSAALAYVCIAALPGEGGALPWLFALALPLAMSEVWRRTNTEALAPVAGTRTVLDSAAWFPHELASARTAVRACAWGAAMWCAARAGPPGRSGFDAAANLGAGVASVAGLLALARIGSTGGMLVPHPATRSLDAASFAALFWSIAVALPATRALLGADVRLDPLAIDYATTTAGAASLFVLVAATWRLRVLRRFEIGVGDRAAGALALAMTAVCVAVPAAALDVAPPDRVLPMGVIAASIACTWAATTQEPSRVSSALRGVVAIMILGAPTTTAAGLLARGAPMYAGVIVLGASCLSIAVGLVARAVARPLGPEQSRWLDAIDAASRGALEPEPDAAIRALLTALSATASTSGNRAELWRNDPEEVLSVDVAGYLHVDKGQAPDRLYELALAEPERTLRAEALRTLEVRRPDVRPLLSWFDARRAFSATVIMDQEGPLGFILLPTGNRTAPMTLEEARAVRLLADRVSALFAVSSALARSRERELLAVRRADELDDERQRLEHIVHHELGRRTSHAERLARRLRQTTYSPRARTALERIEHLGKIDAPVTLVTPLGVDAVPWAAALHLASPRRGGPLFVVDATSSYEHQKETWERPDVSPLVQADGGTLVIVDAPALPTDVQEHIVLALSRRSGHTLRSSILPPRLVISANEPLSQLEASGRILRALSRWLGDAELALPGLQERAEDLRALVLDVVARVGLKRNGVPLGIEPHALYLLVEHRWPGNELELEDVLTRAAAFSAGPAVSAEDLSRAGFRPEAEPADSMTPLPLPAHRRAARRAPRAG
jgi:hypothetical protein